MVPDVEDVHHVRVLVDVDHGRHLALEALLEAGLQQELRERDLDDHLLLQPQIGGLVDGGHAAAAEARIDAIAPFEDLPGQIRSVFGSQVSLREAGVGGAKSTMLRLSEPRRETSVGPPPPGVPSTTSCGAACSTA